MDNGHQPHLTQNKCRFCGLHPEAWDYYMCTFLCERYSYMIEHKAFNHYDLNFNILVIMARLNSYLFSPTEPMPKQAHKVGYVNG